MEVRFLPFPLLSRLSARTTGKRRLTEKIAVYEAADEGSIPSASTSFSFGSVFQWTGWRPPKPPMQVRLLPLLLARKRLKYLRARMVAVV